MANYVNILCIFYCTNILKSSKYQKSHIKTWIIDVIKSVVDYVAEKLDSNILVQNTIDG